MSSSLPPTADPAIGGPPEEGGGAGPELPQGLEYRDPLTGLYNRRLLDAVLADRWPELCARHARVTLLLLDLDGFKEINDSYGHAAGDRALQTAGRMLAASFRDTDLVTRFGGDEFVIVLPGSGPEEAEALAERARRAIAVESLHAVELGLPSELRIGFSLGLASFPADGSAASEILRVADQRMYEEKRRRRVEMPLTATRGARRARRAMAWGAALLGLLVVAGLVLRRELVPASEGLPTTDLETSAALNQRVRELASEVDRLSTELAAERAAQPPGTSSAHIGELERTIAALRERLTASEAEQRRVGSAGAPDARADAGKAAASAPAEAPASPPVTMPASAPAAAPEPSAPPPNELAPRPPAAVEAPVLLELRPRYPPHARERRREATVELRVWVDASGRVVSAEAVAPRVALDFELAAREAALRARYRPGRRDGEPIAMEARLTVVFKLE